VLQCVAVRCSVLQCVAVRCSVLQCVAVRCSESCCNELCVAMRVHATQPIQCVCFLVVEGACENEVRMCMYTCINTRFYVDCVGEDKFVLDLSLYIVCCSAL